MRVVVLALVLAIVCRRSQRGGSADGRREDPRAHRARNRAPRRPAARRSGSASSRRRRCCRSTRRRTRSSAARASATARAGSATAPGSLWIEDTYDSTVSRVSVATGKRDRGDHGRLAAVRRDVLLRLGVDRPAPSTATSSASTRRRNRVVKRIPTGNGAYGVVCAFGIGLGRRPGRPVVRIDPATNRIVARIPVDGRLVDGGLGRRRLDHDAAPARCSASTRRRTASPRRVDVADDEPRRPRRRRRRASGSRSISENEVAVVDPADEQGRRDGEGGQGPFVVTEIAGEAWVPSCKGADIWRVRPCRTVAIPRKTEGHSREEWPSIRLNQLGLRRGASGRLLRSTGGAYASPPRWLDDSPSGPGDTPLRAGTSAARRTGNLHLPDHLLSALRRRIAARSRRTSGNSTRLAQDQTTQGQPRSTLTVPSSTAPGTCARGGRRAG